MIRPRYLKFNDTVALIAPAKNFTASELEPAVEILKGWGLQVKLGDNIYNQNGPFAGTDEERRIDLQAMLDDITVKAIFCVRGGYGCNRIIDAIDWTHFQKNPKWVIGYSDITLLHCSIQRMGVECIHGIMPLQFGIPGAIMSVENLRKTLFGESWSYEAASCTLNRLGSTEGELVGGNLAILCSALGTSSDFDTDGKILFIEDIGEYLYRLDRMIVQLKRAGKFSNLSGLIVGHLTDMVDNPIPFGKNPSEIVFDAVKEYSYPICFNFPIGHEPLNLPMIVGRKALLSVEEMGTRFCFQNYSL